MMKRILLITLAILVVLLSGVSSSCQRSYSGQVESITVAYSPYVETAYYWIAQDQNYFSQNGLDVTFRKYGSLVPAVDEMLKGEVDILGNVTEYLLVSRGFQKANISALACIAQSQTIHLIGRKDRGIQQISDLKGKRVGTLRGTITDFYLLRLLEFNNMSIKDVTLIDVTTAAESVNAVVNGDVDVVVVGQPFANSARDQLGSNAFFESAQYGQVLYALAVSTNDWIINHPELASRFLRSLAQADEYLIRNPAKAQAIVQKQLGFDDASARTFWSQAQFSLSLDQSLILAMEDEARWMISNNLTTEKTVPNFLDFIYPDGLKSVKPEAVRIVGK